MKGRLARVAAVLLAAVILLGCESSTELPGPPEPEPSIQTHGTVFEVTVRPDIAVRGVHAFEVEIPYTFTNRTGVSNTFELTLD